MGKKRTYQKGGLYDTNRISYVDSVLSANKHLDWVQRLYDKEPQTMQIPGQPYPSTHFMGDNDNGYVFPTVVRGQDGKLQYLGDRAEDYARETNTGIQLPKEQGNWFGRSGYKQGTGVLPKKQKGGISTTGYKENSPHKNRDFNIIPSNQITMKGVKKKIVGRDNLGNTQVMHPGMNYQFPGQYVTEFPVMAEGGIHIKKSARGSLHAALGVPQGEKIPASKLQIHESDSSALKKKKQFAINASKFKHQYGGPITEADMAQWEAMQSQAYQQGYQGNDHSRLPGQQFMQQQGVDSAKLQAFQQDFLNKAQTSPMSVRYGDELSKADDIYGHRTSQQRYNKFSYENRKPIPGTNQYQTTFQQGPSYTPMSMQEWDNKVAAQNQPQSPMAQVPASAQQNSYNRPTTAPTLQQQGFLSKEQAIANKKARGDNPDNWYLKKGGTWAAPNYYQMGGAPMQGFQPNPYDPWQAVNPNDPNTMKQVQQPVQQAMANTIPVNNFNEGNQNPMVSPSTVPMGQPKAQPQPYNWQQWGEVAASAVDLQNTVNNTAEAFVDYFGNKKANREAQKRNQWQGSSENLYKQEMYETAGNKGDYVTTGTAYGSYRPQNNKMYEQGGNFTYNKGAEYELDDNEIQSLIAKGYKIKYL